MACSPNRAFSNMFLIVTVFALAATDVLLIMTVTEGDICHEHTCTAYTVSNSTVIISGVGTSVCDYVRLGILIQNATTLGCYYDESSPCPKFSCDTMAVYISVIVIVSIAVVVFAVMTVAYIRKGITLLDEQQTLLN